MLRQLVTAKFLKLSLAATCPVAGTVALSLALPPVRAAVHRATSPRQYAKPKTRERVAAPSVMPRPQSCQALEPFSLAELPVILPSLTQTVLPDQSPEDTIASLTSVSGAPFGPGSGSRAAQPARRTASRNALTDDLQRTDTQVDSFVASVETNIVVSAAPEPGTWVQLLTGFGIIGFAMRRMRRSYERDIQPV
ncbi:PEPxxWA-CTERM sorting domain-containing protein [Sphingomonas crocodyli]|uniref:PEPxxWA-CTERM sorting domain-containing protein n=1 Tax=Sphingomonas crocodyli TaxID=1979270 RepID=UPI0026BA64E8